MKNLILFIIFICSPLFSIAQSGEGLKISGYVETYYTYDFNLPDDHLRPDLLYNFKRANEFNINIALLKASYTTELTRATVALMGGNYAQYNLADEPQWAQMVNEASVGIRLHPKLWLDMGVMPSHIGFESWIGADGWHLSRSIMAENSPYFLTGARLSFAKSEKTDLTLWLTNGWQRVQRIERNQSLGFGFAINHRPLKNLELHYANFFGNEQPQSLRLERFFNNFYAQYIIEKWGFTLGADYGLEEALSLGVNTWYGVTASIKRQIFEKVNLAGRAEYYQDPKGVLIFEGIKVSGLSLNLDYEVSEQAKARLEIRQFFAEDPVFVLPEAKFSRGNTALTGAISFRF
jgi:hypothetical protein